jgi:hypothetical protein
MYSALGTASHLERALWGEERSGLGQLDRKGGWGSVGSPGPGPPGCGHKSILSTELSSNPSLSEFQSHLPGISSTLHPAFGPFPAGVPLSPSVILSPCLPLIHTFHPPRGSPGSSNMSPQESPIDHNSPPLPYNPMLFSPCQDIPPCILSYPQHTPMHPSRSHSIDRSGSRAV